MKKIIFDIETAPVSAEEAEKLAPVFEAPGNIKDPDKIKSAIAEKKAAWLDRLALDATTGGVCAIGLITETGETVMTLTSESSEDVVIRSFWLAFLAHYRDCPFVGFNIFGFDLPFMIRRSWKLGIEVPEGVRTGRYFSQSFVDLMEVYQLGNREQRISLDNLSKFLGVGQKSGNGKDFHLLPPDKQREYLAHDLALTKACADKLIG